LGCSWLLCRLVKLRKSFTRSGIGSYLHRIIDTCLFGADAIEELLTLFGLKIGAIPADIGIHTHDPELLNIADPVFLSADGIL
jgi:hypothetical protein